MADLLAKQENKQEATLKLERNQEVQGRIVLVTKSEVVLDLGGKSEGVLSIKEFPEEQQDKLKEGDEVKAYVVRAENESGQVVLELYKTSTSKKGNPRLEKFMAAKNRGQVLKGRGMEVNRGGLVVEIDKTRGFLPSSLISLSNASKLEDLVDKDIQVTIVEVDPAQNRLILAQKISVSEDAKAKLSKFKAGDKVEGEVSGVMSFGVIVDLGEGVSGLAHVSELSWEKLEDPSLVYKTGDKVTAQVMSIDMASGRVNLSLKQLADDPFKEKAKEFYPDDVVKATVTKVTGQGIILDVKGLEGFIPSAKLEADETYEIGKSISCLVDSVDEQKRRINLAPFITSTKDLIYK